MVKNVPDKTGRFSERPHYAPEELDRECERIISAFLRKKRGDVSFPIITDDLHVLIEQEGASLDAYADLSAYGDDVEGVTEFFPDQGPKVSISNKLANDDRRENRCRITGVENPAHLIASHCKPWRDATNEERLDGENGLLLTPSIDHLFDRGFIGFEDTGKLIISPVAHRPSLQRMGVDTTTVVNVGNFTSGQKKFLDFHRNAVLLQSVRA